MSAVVVAILLFVTVLIVGTVLWPKVLPDAVGRRHRGRRQTTGLQGQVGEWLYWDATLTRPDLARYGEDGDAAKEPPKEPADRALHALVLRQAFASRSGMPEAYQRLKRRARSPAARAFLNGRMRRAIRLHWRTRYRGPDPLYMPWFFLIATVRHGRRHLFLETLTHVMKELNNA